MPLQIEQEDREILLLALREKRLRKLDRLTELRSEAYSLQAEIQECDAKIARYSAVSEPSGAILEPRATPPPSVTPSVITPRGRVRRGESGKIISAKLSELNGTGATTWDLVNSTGTKYSTVRRVLLELQESQLAAERQGKWYFCHALAHSGDSEDLLGARENTLPENGNGRKAKEDTRA